MEERDAEKGREGGRERESGREGEREKSREREGDRPTSLSSKTSIQNDTTVTMIIKKIKTWENRSLVRPVLWKKRPGSGDGWMGN